MDFLVDVLLPFLQTPLHFGEDVRYQKPLSKATTSDGRLAVNAGAEALAFMLYENCLNRSHHLAASKKSENPDYVGNPPFEPANEAGTITTWPLPGEPYVRGKWESPWSATNGGQMKWGGFPKASQEEWKKLREKVKQARERPDVDVDAMERACMMRIRPVLKPTAHPSRPRMYEVGDDSDIE